MVALVHNQRPGHVPESRFGKWFLGTETWRIHVLFRAFADLRRLADRLPERPVVLDAGCGWGASIELLNRALRPSRLIGVDIDPQMIAACHRRAADAGIEVDLRVEDLARLSLEDESVDVAFCHQTLHHVVDQATAMRELRRVLRPGGILMFAESTRAYIHSWIIRLLFRHDLTVQRSADEYIAMLKEAGFAIDETAISYPYLWWSRKDLGIAERLFGIAPPAVREETLLNLVAGRPLHRRPPPTPGAKSRARPPLTPAEV
ncbi:MAG: class I SAM-dependent methyltransferase, partial [Gemmatimonas sp.]